MLRRGILTFAAVLHLFLLDQIVKAFWCLTRLWSDKWIKRVGVEKHIEED